MSTQTATPATDETLESAATPAAVKKSSYGLLLPVLLLGGIFSTGIHVAMVQSLLPEDFTSLLANGMPDSSMLYAGLVLLSASLITWVSQRIAK